MLGISLRLTDVNINFYDVFSLVIKWVQKRVYGNAKEFFPCDFMKASQTNHYYTTCVQLYQKVTPTQMFSYEFCKIFKNTYFVKHF